jgi:hypothetical protein
MLLAISMSDRHLCDRSCQVPVSPVDPRVSIAAKPLLGAPPGWNYDQKKENCHRGRLLVKDRSHPSGHWGVVFHHVEADAAVVEAFLEDVAMSSSRLLACFDQDRRTCGPDRTLVHAAIDFRRH